MLVHMAHRGGTGCEPSSGDGAGIMLALPHSYYNTICKSEMGVTLPAPGNYGTGILFLPHGAKEQTETKRLLTASLNEKGFEVPLTTHTC